MIPRGKLYISYKDSVAGAYYCFTDRFRSQRPDVDQHANELVCLSVRTGIDLVLNALSFPPGSEMIVTDINIPDMFAIINWHELTLVPIPVNKYTLNMSPAQVEAAITPATKAILITHLFGGIMETEAIIAIAKKHNLIIFEDCAQAYAGNLYGGNPASDVVMFSFGFIKTNTAISGAMIKIKDPALYVEVVARNGDYHQQGTTGYYKKLLKVLFVKLLTDKIIYTGFYNLVMALGKDFEKVLDGFTKGFPGDDIFKQIRHQPSTPNQRLLRKKLANFDQHRITKRVQLAHDILSNIPDNYKIGFKNKRHTYWVMPVETHDPEGLIKHLRSNGFDASQKASSLIKLSGAGIAPRPEELTLENLVYLPVYLTMSRKDRHKLTELLVDFPLVK
ncbi:aminotransferase class V-fold PLP-dependent enzyme [Mucilaginibacter pocheonensis]|uniref:dTDP-4-amino-4,6-dideoxygalactose transaminase n=1 Tax=Mucilaginibacter pocheonensis TaxID=398050 RepID=A0ABU1TI90_9SPHI|nr:aminotransferase class V-fold PLP-dependent enzyme [Mucilaginibacter pocheonensis]MDR6945077.1 dTDP-4-amino-4,6-dideoxygalactose transaminase [Mucilaginibacter pocheonensis]